MAIDYSSYLDPKSFQGPNPFYAGASSFLGEDVASFLDPIGGLVSGLFGDDEKKWKPYVDKYGNYVWTDPRKSNPVPLASTPGARLSPSKQYRDMANNVQAIIDLLPLYSQAVSGQIIPQALAELEAKKATSPELAKLMVDLYSRFGPQLNKIGTDITRQNALAQAETDKAVLAGPGKDLVSQALETAKIYDPEYFATRELSSNRLGDLMRSINLDSGLSGSERAEIERSQAQEGTRRGTYNAPSNLDTVSNAMQFGNAGYNRLQQNRSALSEAIANATAALPSFKSGVDVFQVATGKSSVPNTGDSRFTGVDNNASSIANANSLATGLLNNTVSTQQNNAQLALQKKLGEKDWADYLSQVTSSIGSIAGGAASFVP